MAADSADSGRSRLAPGALVGSYLVESQVGAGGMAVVYRAFDKRLGRTVALKVMAPELAADPVFRQRFIGESRAAAAVDHPHILPVFEAGEADGQLFIAMRYVVGGDLRSLAARDGPLAPRRVAEFIVAAASALDAAHAAGLVHRDVKPANMLIDAEADHLYLSDFGLSKGNVGASANLTGSAQVLGTPDYLAPEQAAGAVVDGRTDQYALACAAFSLLAGQPVFHRDNPVAVLLAHASAEPPSLSALRPDLSSAADQVMVRALAKTPGHRYASCGQFAAELAGALDQAASRTPAPPVPAVSPVGPVGHAETITSPGRLWRRGAATGGPPATGPAILGAPADIAAITGAASPPRRSRLRLTGWRGLAAIIALAVALTGSGTAALALSRSHGPAGAGGRSVAASQSRRPAPTPSLAPPSRPSPSSRPPAISGSLQHSAPSSGPSPSSPPAAPSPTPAPSAAAILNSNCVVGYEPAYETSDGGVAYGPFIPGQPTGGVQIEGGVQIGSMVYAPALAYELTFTNTGTVVAPINGFVVAFYDADDEELGSDEESIDNTTYITVGHSLSWTEYSGTDSLGNALYGQGSYNEDDNIPYSGFATCQEVEWDTPG